MLKAAGCTQTEQAGGPERRKRVGRDRSERSLVAQVWVVFQGAFAYGVGVTDAAGNETDGSRPPQVTVGESLTAGAEDTVCVCGRGAKGYPGRATSRHVASANLGAQLERMGGIPVETLRSHFKPDRSPILIGLLRSASLFTAA